MDHLQILQIYSILVYHRTPCPMSKDTCPLLNAWWLPAQVTNYSIIWRAFVHFHEQSHGFVLDCIYAGKVPDPQNRCITAVD